MSIVYLIKMKKIHFSWLFKTHIFLLKLKKLNSFCSLFSIFIPDNFWSCLSRMEEIKRSREYLPWNEFISINFNLFLIFFLFNFSLFSFKIIHWLYHFLVSGWRFELERRISGVNSWLYRAHHRLGHGFRGNRRRDRPLLLCE